MHVYDGCATKPGVVALGSIKEGDRVEERRIAEILLGSKRPSQITDRLLTGGEGVGENWRKRGRAEEKTRLAKGQGCTQRLARGGKFVPGSTRVSWLRS